MDFIGWAIGIAGILYGLWEHHKAKQQGSNLTTFLIGLKGAGLSPKMEGQINDMIARLK
jgi:hypothetical protein